jgi:hypothetical protein
MYSLKLVSTLLLAVIVLAPFLTLSAFAASILASALVAP